MAFPANEADLNVIDDPVEAVADPEAALEADPAPAEAPAEPVEAPEVDPDPDAEFNAWLAGQDKSVVRKNTERFTQERQAFLDEKKALDPLRELQKGLAEDPGLVAHIEKYFDKENADEALEAKYESLERRFGDFQSVVAAERALETLHTTVSKDGMPDFDDNELLQFAADNRIGSLEVAYKALKVDEIAAAKVAKHDADIKANAKAKVETVPKNAGGGTGPKTLEDLESMSDTDFLSSMRK